MKTLFSKNLVSATAIVTSTLLGFGLTNTAQAATHTVVRPPKISAPVMPAPMLNTPISLNMGQLDQRIATLPQLASAQDGTPVTLSDDGTVTHAIWQGHYVFHPAGSIVQPGPMYLRWKDGIVTITPTPSSTPGQPLPGTLDASFVAQSRDINGFPASNYQTIQTLIPDASNPSVLRIPDNAWLFRVDGNGQYTTLVDAFVYQSGNEPVLDQRDANNELPAASGSQPVPVWVNANAS